MSSIWRITSATLRRALRDRSFVWLGLVAPFLIMSALSVAIGPALAGEFRPTLIIVDQSGAVVTPDVVDGLRSSGFEDLTVVTDEVSAADAVEDGTADAAIVLPSAPIDPTGSPEPIRVLAAAGGDVSSDVAASLATQLVDAATTAGLLAQLGAVDSPGTESAGAEPAVTLPAVTTPALITVGNGDDVGSSVLTDATYFAVGMSAYFMFFAAAGFMANYHQERRQSTLARMLLAPINRLSPVAGKAVGIVVLTLISSAALVLVFTLALDADWGPLGGVVAIGLALALTAVAASTAVVAVTGTEEAAAQIGIVVATAWAVFGGVFVEVPVSGPLAQVSRLSPFRWALDGIGLNAGAGTVTEVLQHAAVIALFGVVALIVVAARRASLVRP